METQQVRPAGVPADEEMQSVIGRLRERRVELAKERRKIMEIPGYGGDLYVEYRALTWDEIQAISKRVQKEKMGDRVLLGSMDTLIASCTQMLIKVNDKLKPLSETEEPIRYDEELATALGFSASTAREAIQGTFDNDLAIISQAMELSKWMEGERQEVDEQLMGE